MDKLLFIAGPCVLESEDHALFMARSLKEKLSSYPFTFVFKASFDKANRTRFQSYRGPGLEKGLAWLAKVKREVSVPILTDVHETSQVERVGEEVDILQVPAFLCRQTDLLVACGRTGKPVNIKKGQFMAPEDMRYAVEKVRHGGGSTIYLTERGTFFGYHNLVVDFRSLKIMRDLGVPVIFDATHALQRPSAGSGVSGGEPQFVFPMVRAALAFGVDGLFMEVHHQPSEALSDAATQFPLSHLESLLEQVEAFWKLRRRYES